MRPPRLSNVWKKNAVYFLTICARERNPCLANTAVANILRDEWKNAKDRHGWQIGPYVVMPDHVHFFCSSLEQKKPMNEFIRLWKQWTGKQIRELPGMAAFKWQEGVFDHVLRSSESRSLKWEYVRMNPVRAGLVKDSNDWLFQGSIDFE